MTIPQFFNQFSFFMLPATVLIVAAVILRWRKARPVWWFGWGMAIVGVVMFALFNRMPQTTALKLDTAADIRATIASAGKPTLVEFYSNY